MSAETWTRVVDGVEQTCAVPVTHAGGMPVVVVEADLFRSLLTELGWSPS